MCSRISPATPKQCIDVSKLRYAGEMIEQYEGGAASIEAGARRDANELVADAVGWSQRLDMRFASLPEKGWRGAVRSVAGGEYPISALPCRR